MKKIFLIDWNSFIYRMFFWLPEFSTKDGKVVNAIFWMAKFFVDTLVKQKPDSLVFITDPKWDTFRNEIFADYKATRDRMPDNLRAQIDDIYKMIEMMWIDIVKVDGYEADDVIGTLAVKLWLDKNQEVYILSGDKDLYSLITENVFIYDTMKKKVFNSEAAQEKFWVHPNGIIDYLAIVWDKADNIPGIDWFWPKKAVELINKIGNIDEIYKVVKKVEFGEKLEELFPNLSADDIKAIASCFKGKTFEKLQWSYDDAILSKKLATIILDIDLPGFDIKNYDFTPENYINDEVKEFFKECEFFSLLSEDEQIKTTFWRDLWLAVKTISTDSELEKLQKQILWSNNWAGVELSLDTETTSLEIIEAELLWVSIYLDDKNIYYINAGHTGAKVSSSKLRLFLESLLESECLIIGHNLKYDLQIIDLYLKSDNSHWESGKGEQNSLF